MVEFRFVFDSVSAVLLLGTALIGKRVYDGLSPGLDLISQEAPQLADPPARCSYMYPYK